jgi:L-ascorbate metabolism protein UlaG (beta-lactamase superfamily)
LGGRDHAWHDRRTIDFCIARISFLGAISSGPIATIKQAFQQNGASGIGLLPRLCGLSGLRIPQHAYRKVAGVWARILRYCLRAELVEFSMVVGVRFLQKAVIAIACFVIAQVASSFAQSPPSPSPAKPELRTSCPGLVAADKPRAIPAAFKLAALASDQIRITYVGHATFLIESPQLVRIATDYNDYVRPPLLPDIVTMNHAHSTHYTDRPDSNIKLVLRGWRDDGKPSAYDVTYRDVRIRSVATNIRDLSGGTERHGNSIFVFEIAGLCIAHLGHLHHTLTQQQLDELGRIDVVFVPVDGSYTLDIEGMIDVLQSLKASLIIPMHFFSSYTLDRFVARVRAQYPVEFNETPALVLSKATLPTAQKVLVLPGR